MREVARLLLPRTRLPGARGEVGRRWDATGGLPEPEPARALPCTPRVGGRQQARSRAYRGQRYRLGREGDGPVPGRPGPDDRLAGQALERPDDLVLPEDAVGVRHRVRVRRPAGRSRTVEPGRAGRHRAHEQLGPPAGGPRRAPRPATRQVAERVAARKARVWRWVGCRFWVSWAAWS